MFILGLTGPTGAGKSLVSVLLKKQGFATLDTDEISRRAVEPGTKCLEELKTKFGAAIILPDGSLDRKQLGKLVFSDKALLESLNAVTHPYIMALIKAELSKLLKNGFEKVVLDAPALFEAQADTLCDKVIAVVASRALRLERIMVRDAMTRSEAQARLDAQPTLEYYTAHSDYILENSGDIENLKNTLKDIFNNNKMF
jgi:dephospho-CoA kinase